VTDPGPWFAGDPPWTKSYSHHNLLNDFLSLIFQEVKLEQSLIGPVDKTVILSIFSVIKIIHSLRFLKEGKW
jgi:hypothetical protein